MDQIGRYKILGELGRGAMGVVFKALDPSIGREVAIKTIRLAEFTDAGQRGNQRERLFREARSAGILNHPSIVTIYDMAEQGDTAYIAMEYVDGSTLEDLLSTKDPLPPERVFSVLRETAAGLDYAHRKGIIHRDIKPANIMLTEAGAAKIADFGIAKISAADQLTQTGLIVGTPNYMSPEQVQGKTVAGFSDQYSLTVLAYEMLTGDKPFVAEQLTTLVYQIVCEPAPPAQRLNPTLGARVEEVLQKGLSKQPEQRYPTCSAMVEALEAACGATPGWKSLARGGSLNLPTMGEAPAAPPPRAPEPEVSSAATIVANLPPPRVRQEEAPRRKSRAAPILATLAVVAGLAGALYYFTRPTVTVAPEPTAAVPPPKKREPPPKPAVSAKSGQASPASSNPASSAAVEVPRPVKKEVAVKDSASIPSRLPTSVDVPVRSEPSGATATLDELPGAACVTPCVLKASLGDHTISLNLAGFRKLTRPMKVKDASFELPVLTMAPAAGVLMVQSEPEGASVLVDDKRWPSLTPAQISLPPGKYRITVEKGDLKTTQSIEINDGSLKHMSVSLNQ
jgi:serine/threonine protein kinase